MEHRFYIMSSYDGFRLSISELTGTDTSCGTILFIHGLCGRKERYIGAMNHFCQKGFRCIAMDLRGHGDSVRSEEERGYTNQVGYKGIVSDIRSVTSYIKSTHPDSPLFIIAHSMGSLAARSYIKEYDQSIDGLILCGSISYTLMGRAGLMLARILSIIDKGRRRYASLQEMTSSNYNRRFRHEGRQAWTCSDPEIRKSFDNDPKCSYTPTVDCTLTLLEMMKETYSTRGWHMTKPSLPILFISGADDPCMVNLRHFHRSAGFLNKVGYTDVSSMIFPRMRHEVLNEKGKESVYNAIIEFIKIN